MHLISAEIEKYCIEHSRSEADIYERLTEETYRSEKLPQMLSGPLVGNFLQLMVRQKKAQSILEIGTFTGYSALKLAEAQENGGSLITCEINPHAIQFSQKYFDQAAWGNRINIKQGPALESINNLLPTFDLIFIDADKINYLNYYKRSLELLVSGGIIILDNSLWGGAVLDPKSDNDRAIAQTNDFIQKDSRVINQLIPLRDGLMVVEVL